MSKSRSIKAIELDAESEEAKSFMKLIKEQCDEDCEDCGKERKLIKSIPLTAKWKAKWELLEKQRKICDKLHEELVMAMSKASSIKASFWSDVEMDLDRYDDLMKYNKETKEVEIYEEI